MTIPRKALCLLYGLIAIVALIGTWTQFPAYLQHGYFRGFNLFWEDTLLNHASRFITVESLLIDLIIMIWSVMEARRLGIRGVWLYMFFGVFVAISLTFPLFMIHRERVLARREVASIAGTLGRVDIVGLTVVGLMVVAYVATAFTR